MYNLEQDLTFENQMVQFGGWDGVSNLFFGYGEKKELSHVHQKWVLMKLESAEKCVTHIQFLLTVVLTMAPLLE